MTQRIVMLRHGATQWSLDGKHTGRSDIPLVDLGCRQAAAAGQLLRGMRFAQVLMSPLQRASETCALAGFDGEPDPDLMEWDYGSYEGRSTPDIRVERPGWSLWIERARQADGDTLCVAHGHVLRVLTARWVGLPPVAGRLWWLGTATVSILGWERETPVVTLWNQSPAGVE
jgi:broad specificity phosphatase PhoE